MYMYIVHMYTTCTCTCMYMCKSTVPPHVPLCLLQGEYKAQKEAVWAITNLTAGGNLEQVGVVCLFF